MGLRKTPTIESRSNKNTFISRLRQGGLPNTPAKLGGSDKHTFVSGLLSSRAVRENVAAEKVGEKSLVSRTLI